MSRNKYYEYTQIKISWKLHEKRNVDLKSNSNRKTASKATYQMWTKMKKVSELGIRDDYCTEMELRRFYEVPICADFECFLFLETL